MGDDPRPHHKNMETRERTRSHSARYATQRRPATRQRRLTTRGRRPAWRLAGWPGGWLARWLAGRRRAWGEGHGVTGGRRALGFIRRRTSTPINTSLRDVTSRATPLRTGAQYSVFFAISSLTVLWSMLAKMANSAKTGISHSACLMGFGCRPC